MASRIEGLTYSHLKQVLERQGFTETVDDRGRTFDHPSGARLPLPMLRDSESLRAYHFIATRGILNDYGILPAEAFELLMMRLAQEASLTANSIS
jgi:hypothetical protein